MERRRLLPFTNSLAAGLAIAFALITIIGLMAPADSMPGRLGSALLQLVAVLLAFAVISGIVNLIIVHVRRFLKKEPGSYQSLLLIVTLILVITVHLVDRADLWRGELSGEELSPRLFGVLQIALEAALAGLIFFFLIYAAYRLLSRQFTWSSLVFVTTIVVILAGSSAILEGSFIEESRDWVMDIPVTAGTRGLLIGIGLGTVITGIRVITGQERAYREPTVRN